MTDTQPSSTLREMRSHLGSPAVLAALAGTSVILALSGPFRTLDLLDPLPRAAYWAAVVFGTYAIGTAVLTLLWRWQPFGHLHPVARVALASPLMGFAVALALSGLDTALPLGPGRQPPDLAQLATLTGIATVISATILIPQEMHARPRTRAPATPPASAPRPPSAHPPAILSRLPAGRRGPLLALSAEDHYVRVITTAGETLVLMRLRDAITEARGTDGLQVHRSHWVAHDAARTARRDGDGAVITLPGGQRIPVSRRFLPALRQAGLMAQGTGDGNARMDHL